MLDPQGKWSDVIGEINIALSFDQDMDQTVKPPLGSWEAERNDVPINVTGSSWFDERVFIIVTDGVPAGTTRVDLAFPTEHPNLRTLAGLQHTPFQLEDIPDPPWLYGGLASWQNDHPPPPLEDPEHPAWLHLCRVHMTWLIREAMKGNIP